MKNLFYRIFTVCWVCLYIYNSLPKQKKINPKNSLFYQIFLLFRFRNLMFHEVKGIFPVLKVIHDNRPNSFLNFYDIIKTPSLLYGNSRSFILGWTNYHKYMCKEGKAEKITFQIQYYNFSYSFEAIDSRQYYCKNKVLTEKKHDKES
jgi:hypothetical protein